MRVLAGKFNLSKDIKSLKDKILRSRREISIERTQLLTESYKKTEGEPTIMRRAKVLRHILNNF